MECLRLERLPRVNLTVDLDDVHILDCAHQDSQKTSVMGYHGGSSENVDAHVYNIHTHKCIHTMYIHRYTHVHNVSYILAQMCTYVHIDVYTQTMDIYMQTYTDVHA